MTRISFYLLKGSNHHERQLFACRLIEKAYYQQHQIYIHTESEQQTEQLNQLLWTFRKDSFIPHQLAASTDDTEQCPILIGHDQSPPRIMSLLINFAEQQPIFFSQFERLVELVNDDEPIKVAGRQRYRFYQQRGYQLETIKL